MPLRDRLHTMTYDHDTSGKTARPLDRSGHAADAADASARPAPGVSAGLLTIAVSAIVAIALGAGTMPVVRSAISARSDVSVVFGESGAARVVAAVVAVACDLLGIGDRAVAMTAAPATVASAKRPREHGSIGRTFAVRLRGPGLHHLDLPPPAAR